MAAAAAGSRPGSYAAAAAVRRVVAADICGGGGHQEPAPERIAAACRLVKQQVAAEREAEREWMRDNARRRRRLQKAARAAAEQEEALRELALRARRALAAAAPQPALQQQQPVGGRRRSPPVLHRAAAAAAAPPASAGCKGRAAPTAAESAELSVKGLVAALSSPEIRANPAAAEATATRLSGSIRSLNRLLRASADGVLPPHAEPSAGESTELFLAAEAAAADARAAARTWADFLLSKDAAPVLGTVAAAAAPSPRTRRREAAAVREASTGASGAWDGRSEASSVPSSAILPPPPPEPSSSSPLCSRRWRRRPPHSPPAAAAVPKAVRFTEPQHTDGPPADRCAAADAARCGAPVTGLSCDEAALERSLARLDELLRTRRERQADALPAAAAVAASPRQPQDHGRRGPSPALPPQGRERWTPTAVPIGATAQPDSAPAAAGAAGGTLPLPRSCRSAPLLRQRVRCPARQL
eukprot:TRINITY_DN948_c0_g1_i2.p1 TRINITY_DN948_c0_g1~~TRINITY_DN948_c0_g1_i2.p1  ORF type:complete len:500 (+),score=83.54 TRINITY_DN948_c0_g1_i2:85-1500(+)